MGDSTTIALNLTFFGTLGLAFLMFMGLFLLVVLALVVVGVGRLVALLLMALFGRLPTNETLPLVRLSGESGPAGAPVSTDVSTHDGDAAARPAGKPAIVGVLRATAGVLRGTSIALWEKYGHRPPPVPAADWAAAVAEADARAIARARAAAPETKISVPVLPVPGTPVEIVAVAPLVESALHQDQAPRDVPRSFIKPPPPPPLSPLNTGSLMSLSGQGNVLKGKRPANRR